MLNDLITTEIRSLVGTWKNEQSVKKQIVDDSFESIVSNTGELKKISVFLTRVFSCYRNRETINR